MNTKHTPGPWKCESGQVLRNDGAVIARMDRTDEATKAGIYPVERDLNARLISAAPELLEACKDALRLLKVLNVTGSNDPIESIHYKLENLIAKTEGRDA